MKTLMTLFFLVGFVHLQAQGPSSVNSSTNWDENRYLVRGETLKYKIKYGWFKIGDAEVYNDAIFHQIDGEPHYKIEFRLKTAGLLKVFANLDIHFESYVNAKSFLPHHSVRKIRNGKKTNNQFDEFAYQDSIYVKTFREETDKTKNHAYPAQGPTFADALSTYLYVRAQELQMRRDENVRFYIANRLYDFKMEPNSKFGDKDEKSYELIFPPIKQFPRNKTSYAILEDGTNIPLEIKLATNDGNFYLILDD